MMRASHEVRNAYAEFIVAQGGTHAVTLAYNTRYGGTSFPCTRVTASGKRLQVSGSRDTQQYRLPTIRHVPLETVQADVRHLQAKVERPWFHGRYNTAPVESRGSYIGFTENEDANIHVHLSWRVPEERTSSFSASLEAAWKRMQPYGSCWIEPVTDGGWARYITKKLREDEAAALIVSGV